MCLLPLASPQSLPKRFSTRIPETCGQRGLERFHSIARAAVNIFQYGRLGNGRQFTTHESDFYEFKQASALHSFASSLDDYQQLMIDDAGIRRAGEVPPKGRDFLTKIKGWRELSILRVILLPLSGMGCINPTFNIRWGD